MKKKQPWDAATKTLIESINSTVVSKDEMLEAAKETSQLDAESRNFEGHVVTLLRLHPDDSEKVRAIMFRLEALARLLSREGAPGWTLLKRPDGAVLTEQSVFAAAAVQPLIEEGGDVVFEPKAFLEKVLELAQTKGVH